MQITAKVNNVSVAPRKVRLVAESVRRLSATSALASLSYIKKRASHILRKTLENAIVNAKSKNLKEDNLHIKSIDVFEGRSLKRFRPSTRGRVHPYKKRTTNIRITLEGTEQDKGGKEEASKALIKGGEK